MDFALRARPGFKYAVPLKHGRSSRVRRACKTLETTQASLFVAQHRGCLAQSRPQAAIS